MAWHCRYRGKEQVSNCTRVSDLLLSGSRAQYCSRRIDHKVQEATIGQYQIILSQLFILLPREGSNSLIGKEEHLQADLDGYNSEEDLEPPHEPDYPFEALDFVRVLSQQFCRV